MGKKFRLKKLMLYIMKSKEKSREQKIFKSEATNQEIVTHRVLFYQHKINKTLLKFMKCSDSNTQST